MERPLEGKVISAPHSYFTEYGKPMTTFKLEVDKTKLDGLIMPDVVDVTIQEKVRINRGETIRGYYNDSSTKIWFNRYEPLDEKGNPRYKNTICVD